MKQPINQAQAGVQYSHENSGRKKLKSLRSEHAFRKNPPASSTHSVEPIAVIGIAGQFPKARNLNEFWRNIAEGKDCVEEIPQERWDVHAYYESGDPVEGKTNSKWAGLLDEYSLFDPLFFNISPVEAESMDPQQRVFLQACWHAVEDAGYRGRALSGSNCGVFVGCSANGYQLLSRDQQLSALGFTGDANSILAARISYFLDLHGPCLSIDTACSSSLVAIANACDSLITGGSDLALAGGVYVMAGPELHVRCSQVGMLSSTGRCFTFDQRANGFVPGEGVGVVVLKRLSDAQGDNDNIQGVIEGWGINQDGRTNGITAPNPDAQARLQKSVYEKYRIDPAAIQLIEAHGTGTKLGDPIEVDGLKSCFREYTRRKSYCALGSVKSNVGHCLTAAGVSGFIKVILALKNKALPPTINYAGRNEHIDLGGSPFYINEKLREWKVEEGGLRRAAINSFGFSGTNAHLVVAEYVPQPTPQPAFPAANQDNRIVIPLSARTENQLQQKVRDLLDFILGETSVDLTEMAYTLQVGRTPMDERLGLVADSRENLAGKLRSYLGGGENIEDTYRGRARRDRDDIGIIAEEKELQESIIEKWMTEKQLSKLLKLWAKGLDIDWNGLYGDTKPRRISAPVYPFAKERYWVKTPNPTESEFRHSTLSPGEISYFSKWEEQPPLHDEDALVNRTNRADHRTVLIVRSGPCFRFDEALADHYKS